MSRPDRARMTAEAAERAFTKVPHARREATALALAELIELGWSPAIVFMLSLCDNDAKKLGEKIEKFVLVSGSPYYWHDRGRPVAKAVRK